MLWTVRDFIRVLLELVDDASIPELSQAEALSYARSVGKEDLRVGGFFPTNMLIAARSLKLTRRLFHVSDSSICSERGLWLKRGASLSRGDFVGFYVGWLYSDVDTTAVWDAEYLDRSYSLGLEGMTVRDAVDGVKVHARDDSFARQELIFTLGFTNEWIWEGEGRRSRRGDGNVLKFGRFGMMFAQRSLIGSGPRVEVTVGFGKEGPPFGGWARYTIKLAGRLLKVVRLVWMEVQEGLRQEVRDHIVSQLQELGQQLQGVEYHSLPSLRADKSLVAILIAGVELQVADESWGSLVYSAKDSFADNLRRFVIHPKVRERCTFRLADMPYRAESKCVGDKSYWVRVLSKSTKSSVAIESRGPSVRDLI
jgi:hypothetical protein